MVYLSILFFRLFSFAGMLQRQRKQKIFALDNLWVIIHSDPDDHPAQLIPFMFSRTFGMKRAVCHVGKWKAVHHRDSFIFPCFGHDFGHHQICTHPSNNGFRPFKLQKTKKRSTYHPQGCVRLKCLTTATDWKTELNNVVVDINSQRELTSERISVTTTNLSFHSLYFPQHVTNLTLPVTLASGSEAKTGRT